MPELSDIQFSLVMLTLLSGMFMAFLFFKNNLAIQLAERENRTIQGISADKHRCIRNATIIPSIGLIALCFIIAYGGFTDDIALIITTAAVYLILFLGISVFIVSKKMLAKSESTT